MLLAGLALSFAAPARAQSELPPVLIVHLDPAAAAEEGAWSGEIGARVEFPLVVAALGEVMDYDRPGRGGAEAVNDVLIPFPPLSAMYTGYAARTLANPARWSGGGGLAVRWRPLVQTRVSAARGLWIDLGGRYGTRGWGMDGGVGWDLPITRGFAIGPAGTFAWEGEAFRLLATVSLSFSRFVDVGMQPPPVDVVPLEAQPG